MKYKSGISVVFLRIIDTIASDGGCQPIAVGD